MRRNVFVFCLLALYANTINARQLDIQPGEDIKTAIENLVAGDTLWVKTGTYEVSDLINVRHSGNRHHRICVFGYDTEKGKRPAANPVFDFSKQP